MAESYNKEAALYLEARPQYPAEWFSRLASLTSHRSLAWDAGTGSGQAALGLADHYDKVVATDISEEQLKSAPSHPRVHYKHSPLSISEDEFVDLVGGENSVDLVTAACAVHWFDLEKFYSIVKRVLKKPGGVIAVWTYNIIQVNPEFDPLMQRFADSAAPFRDPKTNYPFQCYKNLPFPFESVGLGSEGQPEVLDMHKEMSIEGVIRLLGTWSATLIAKEQGVDLLTDDVVNEFVKAWGGPGVVRNVVYKTYLIAGKVKL